jgi:hypothetical protein
MANSMATSRLPYYTTAILYQKLELGPTAVVAMPLRDDVKGKCGTVLLNALKERRPSLDEEGMQACMQLLISDLGNLTSELIVRIPFSIMKTQFEGRGLSGVDLITFEDLLSDTPIFPRGASSAFDEFETKDEAESNANGQQPQGESGRGGCRMNSLPALKKRRITPEYAETYYHPEAFYNLPSKMTKLEDEKMVLTTIFKEIVDTAGDSYCSKMERKMVTDPVKLRAIGIGEPRPYGVPPKPRTWDVRAPRP